MTRLGAALVVEVRVQWRYRVPVVALVVTVLWTATLLALPPSVARGAGPVILLLDTATFGSFFIAALILFERGEGALAALSVSPLRLGEYLAVTPPRRRRRRYSGSTAAPTPGATYCWRR